MHKENMSITELVEDFLKKYPLFDLSEITRAAYFVWDYPNERIESYKLEIRNRHTFSFSFAEGFLVGTQTHTVCRRPNESFTNVLKMTLDNGADYLDFMVAGEVHVRKD